MMDWRPATEPPSEPRTTAILMVEPTTDEHDDTTPYLLDGLWIWTGAEWRHERTGQTPAFFVPSQVWWCAERGLIAHCAARIASRRNGHG